VVAAHQASAALTLTTHHQVLIQLSADRPNSPAPTRPERACQQERYMPIIVPIEENHESIAGLTDAKFRAPDYSGSGLEALGAGLAKFGESGGQFAGALDEKRQRKLAAIAAIAAIAAAKLDNEHQSHIDDAAVKRAYVDYSDQTHEALHGDNGLFNQRGALAHAAFPDLVEKLVDNHDKALAPLDEVQRAALAPTLGARLRSDVDVAARRVREQGKAEQKWQAESLQQTAGRDAIANVRDPDLHDHNMATGENSIAQQGRLKNLPADEVDRQIANYKSAVHAATIEELIPHDPVHAAGWYARYGDKLNDFDKQRVAAKLGPALADARAVADVDAARVVDPTTAPANPHAGGDATLLLKMQGITPMMDQTELPALVQRYDNDPAKAWAAFAAGPDYLDRLIATKGGDWYASVGDDVRHFVSQNIARLGGSKSARTEPEGPVTLQLQMLASNAPDRFHTLDLRQYRDLVAPQEYGLFQRVQQGEVVVRPVNSIAGEIPNVIGLRSMDAGARNDVPMARGSDADAGGMSHVDALRASFIPTALQVSQGKPAGGAPSAGNTSGAASATNDDSVAADGLTSKHLASTANGGPDQAGARTPIISDSTLAELRAKAASPQRQARNRAQAAEDLRDPVVITLLHMIAYYEGPDRANGYAQIQGKLKKTDPKITDFSRFPDIGNIAGGRYQIERKNMYATGVQDLGIESFNPVDQDMMATYVLRHYGVIDKIKAGDFAGAMPALAKFWRSLPLPGRDSGVSGDARGSFPTFVKIFNELYPLVQAEQERHLVYDNGLRYLAPLAPMMPGVDKVAAAMRGHQDLRGVLDKYRLFDKKK
jgi:muramidase (phage lysozyme)